MDTKENILNQTTYLLARKGYDGTTMRLVAQSIGREPSVLYAHFSDKEALLRAVRTHITRALDASQQYTEDADTLKLLKETIAFQIEHRVEITALLQYFMSMRKDFPAAQDGRVPERAYLHMVRVIQQGITEGRYQSADVGMDAKACTHLINGYLMEYFDVDMTQEDIDKLTTNLAGFIDRALKEAA